jgi:hypothetical protein
MQTKAMDNLIRLYANNPQAFYDIDIDRNDDESKEIVLYIKTLESIDLKEVSGIAAHGGIKEEKSKNAIIIHIKEQIAGKC